MGFLPATPNSVISGTLTVTGTVTSASGFAGTGLAGATLPGGVDINLAGAGMSVKEGANAKQGTATLAAGTVTVANTSVTANSRIFVSCQTLGTVTVASAFSVTRVPGTSFTITASQATDTSVVAWEIFEPG